MRLVDIEIKRYKSILDQHLSPSAFTVLIGRNNAGKSNVINLLEDFQEYWNKNDPGGEWLESRKYKGAIDSVDIGIQFELESEEYSKILDHTNSPKLHRQRSDFKKFRVYRNFRNDAQTYDLTVFLDENWVDPQDLEEQEEYPEYFADLFSQPIDKSVSSWRFISPFRKPQYHTNPAHIDSMDSTGEDLIRALDSLRSTPRHSI